MNNLKYVVAVVALACIAPLQLIAQELTTAEKEAYAKIAQETCDCISKQNVSSMSKDEVKMALGLCLLESAKKNNLELDISDPEKMRGLGAKVGVIMATQCPGVFKAFVSDSKDDDRKEKAQLVEGKIKSVDTKSLVTLVLREESGQEQRLVWFSYVNGLDSFLEDPKKLAGKKVKIEFRTIQSFQASAKGYMSIKEIVTLEIIE